MLSVLEAEGSDQSTTVPRFDLRISGLTMSSECYAQVSSTTKRLTCSNNYADLFLVLCSS